jgi:hypothetical protein
MADVLVELNAPAAVQMPQTNPATDQPLTDPTAAVSVIVKRDGTVVGAPLTAVHVTANLWTVTVPAQTVLGEVVLSWPDGDRTVEAVTGLRVTRARVRERPADKGKLDDPARWPSWQIDRAVAVAHDELADIIGVTPFRRRTTERHVVDQQGVRLLGAMWRNTNVQLISVAVDGTALSATDLAALTVTEQGRIVVCESNVWRPWRYNDAPSTVLVTYEHGDPAVMTSSLTEALTRRCAHLVTSTASALPNRVERSYSDQNGNTVFFASAGFDRTGIPDVDAVYHRHRESHGLTA